MIIYEVYIASCMDGENERESYFFVSNEDAREKFRQLVESEKTGATWVHDVLATADEEDFFDRFDCKDAEDEFYLIDFNGGNEVGIYIEVRYVQE